MDAVLDVLREGEAVVASHWGLEIANGLLVAERRDRVTPQDVPRLVKFLLALPIAVDPTVRKRPVETVRRLARTHGLSAYDAAYLDLAVRHGVPVASLDAALRAAAEAEGVGVLRV